MFACIWIKSGPISAANYLYSENDLTCEKKTLIPSISLECITNLPKQTHQC